MSRARSILLAIKTLQVSGGAERVFTDLAKGLAGRGHKVTVLTFDPPGAEPFYPLGQEVRWIPLGVGDPRARASVLDTIRRMAALRRAIGDIRPDLAIGFLISMYVPLGLVAILTRLKVIASEHTTLDRYRTRPIERTLLHLTPLFARAIVVVDERIRDSYPGWLARRALVIPNPISIRPDRRADVRGETRSPKVLLSVGRLVESKDVGTLVSAFAEASRHCPDWKLRVVGDGPQRASLEARVRSIGLQDKIVFVGPVSDVAEEFVSAQLFATASRYEGQGLAVVEALSYGLPVVAFADCPGIRELVIHGANGVLMGEGDRVGEMSRALATLMSDAQRRSALSAHGFRVPEGSAPEEVIPRWEGLCDRLCGDLRG